MAIRGASAKGIGREIDARVRISPAPPVYPICYVHVCVDLGHAWSAISVKNNQAADCVLRTWGFIWSGGVTVSQRIANPS